MNGTPPTTPDSLHRPIPSYLLALGRRPVPDELDILGRRYHRRITYKHDFFAATALYESEAIRVLVKFNRQAPLGPVPLQWLGRWLARRECLALNRLDGLAGIPRFLVRVDATSYAREHVEGKTLRRGDRVGGSFHERLAELVGRIHDRGMAYVDLEKCENVLVTSDEAPYLFDFQLAWIAGTGTWGDWWPARWLRSALQAGDRYHLVKLRRRIPAAGVNLAELAGSYRKPWPVRLHARITRPLTLVRRRILHRIDPRRSVGERGRLHDARWFKDDPVTPVRPEGAAPT